MNTSKPKHNFFRILISIAGLLLIGFLLLSLSRQSSIGGWLNTFAGFENDSYKVYPTSTVTADYYGRVLAKIRTQPRKMQTAASAADASTKAGFQVHTPQYLPDGFEPLNPYDITGEQAYEIAIHVDEARRILEAAGLPTGSLPAAAVIDKIDVEIPASVAVYQNQGERWFTLIQSMDGHVSLPEGIDPKALQSVNELGLRYLGLAEQNARQVSQEYGWDAILVTPPTDLKHAERSSVAGAPALVLYQSQFTNSLRAVIWKADGVLYGLYGGLPAEELLKIAESME